MLGWELGLGNSDQVGSTVGIREHGGCDAFARGAPTFFRFAAERRPSAAQLGAGALPGAPPKHPHWRMTITPDHLHRFPRKNDGYDVRATAVLGSYYAGSYYADFAVTVRTFAVLHRRHYRRWGRDGCDRRVRRPPPASTSGGGDLRGARASRNRVAAAVGGDGEKKRQCFRCESAPYLDEALQSR